MKNNNSNQSLMLEVIVQVAEMRRLQKEYFRGRSPYVLKKCKHVEMKVDRLLSECISEGIMMLEGQTVAQIIQSSFKFTES